MINGRPVAEYFLTLQAQRAAEASLVATESTGTYDVFVRVNGGGITGQSEAISMGIARALRTVNPATFDTLREGGLLTRDSRSKERKKYGRRGARRGFQFSKR